MARLTLKPYPKDHPIFSGQATFSAPVSRPSMPSSPSESPEAEPVPQPEDLNGSMQASHRPER